MHFSNEIKMTCLLPCSEDPVGSSPWEDILPSVTFSENLGHLSLRFMYKVPRNCTNLTGINT